MHSQYSSPTDTAGGAVASSRARRAMEKLRVKESASLVIRLQPAGEAVRPRPRGHSKHRSWLSFRGALRREPEFPVPDLEAQQTPEQLFVVLAAGRMLIDVTAQRLRTVVIPRAGLCSQQV